MTRARILADYVAGGTTAPEFDHIDGLTSTAVGINDTQTLANKTLASTTTFPAGHIITTASTLDIATSYWTNDYTEIECTNYTCTIDKKISGSKIVIIANPSIQTYALNCNHASYCILWFNRTAPTAATDFGKTYQYIHDENNNDPYHNVTSMNCLIAEDTSSATGNHTYIAKLKAGNEYSGAGGDVPAGGMNPNGKSSILLLEVVT